MRDFTVDNRNWGKPNENSPFVFEPQNRGRMGESVKPGECLRVRAKDGQSVLLFREDLHHALTFLDMQKETADDPERAD